MTCDEAKERAVIFRAALSNVLTAGADLPLVLDQVRIVLKQYPFDPEAMTVLRKMAKESKT